LCFQKVRVQTTVALSKLNLPEAKYLRKSLATLELYAEEDKNCTSDFRSQVIEYIHFLTFFFFF